MKRRQFLGFMAGGILGVLLAVLIMLFEEQKGASSYAWYSTIALGILLGGFIGLEIAIHTNPPRKNS